MKQFMKNLLFLSLFALGTLSVFLEDGSYKLVSTEDLNLENISDLNMSDEQKAQLMQNFLNMDLQGAEEVNLLTPDKTEVGDVTGVLMNKTEHEVQRTPNLDLYTERQNLDQVHVVHQPLTIYKAKVKLVDQHIKGPKQVHIVEPSALLPNIVESETVGKVVSAPSAVNAPDVRLSPEGIRAMPTIEIPSMESNLESLSLEAIPDSPLPNLEINELSKELPTMNISEIEAKAVPSLSLPKLEGDVPSIELAAESEIPSIGLPNMDRDMSDFSVPNMKGSDIVANKPEMNFNMNDFNVDRVNFGGFSDFSVPSMDNDMASFNVPLKRSGNMDVVFDDIRMPNVAEVQGPNLQPIVINDQAAHRLVDINVANVPHPIYTPQVDAPHFNPLQTIDVADPKIAAFEFSKVSPLVEPEVYIPPAGLRVPIREPKQIQLQHEQLLAKNQQVINDHVIYVPQIILENKARTQMPRFRTEVPNYRHQDFIFPVYRLESGLRKAIETKDEKVYVVLPAGEFPASELRIVIDQEDSSKVAIALDDLAIEQVKEAEEEKEDKDEKIYVVAPEGGLDLDNLDDLLNTDVDDIINQSIIPEDADSEEEGQDFVYDFSFLKDRPNYVAWEPNMYKSSHMWVNGPQGYPVQRKISYKDLDGVIVGDSLSK
jgi:hypothetical protein